MICSPTHTWSLEGNTFIRLSNTKSRLTRLRNTKRSCASDHTRIQSQLLADLQNDTHRGNYYGAIAKNPEMGIKLTGSWEVIVGELDTFCKRPSHRLKYRADSSLCIQTTYWSLTMDIAVGMRPLPNYMIAQSVDQLPICALAHVDVLP